MFIEIPSNRIGKRFVNLSVCTDIQIAESTDGSVSYRFQFGETHSVQCVLKDPMEIQKMNLVITAYNHLS